jgi:hypothetical protein
VTAQEILCGRDLVFFGFIIEQTVGYHVSTCIYETGK